MKITIEGARFAPSWQALQELLNTVLEDYGCYGAGKGKLTCISRPDHRANYRALGTYDLTFEYVRFFTPEVENITLEVK